MSLLSELRSHRHICWYPSAGADFRELLFLSKKYIRQHHVPLKEDDLPDLFLLSDVNAENGLLFGNHYAVTNILGEGSDRHGFLYCEPDGRTLITHSGFECIDGLPLSFDRSLCILIPSPRYGKVFKTRVQVHSDTLGDWSADLIYVLAENVAFGTEFLLKEKVKLDYVLRVCYGDHFGGATVDGDWLLKVLTPLRTRYFLSVEVEEESFFYNPPELARLAPELAALPALAMEQLKCIYRVPEKSWSRQGDILWYRVEHNSAL